MLGLLRIGEASAPLLSKARVCTRFPGTSKEAERRAESGGGPAATGNGGCPSSSSNGGMGGGRRRASSWGDLPCTVEANLFSRLRDETSPHAARSACRSWKAAVEQNLTHLTASPRGEDGLGCLCYLRSFRSIEELKVMRCPPPPHHAQPAGSLALYWMRGRHLASQGCLVVLLSADAVR